MPRKSPISRSPDIMSGAVVFSGTRVLVRSLFDYLEGGETLDTFLEHFPTVSREQAVEVLELASDHLMEDGDEAAA